MTLHAIVDRLSRNARLIIAVTCAGAQFLSAGLFAQDEGVRRNSPLLHVLPWNLSSPYLEGLDRRATIWIYPGEPFVIELTLSNDGNRAINVKRRGVEWWDATHFSLESLEINAQPAVLTLSARVFDRRSLNRTGSPSADLPLSPRSFERLSLRLEPSGGSIPVGIYKLAVSLDGSFLTAAGQAETGTLSDNRVVGFRALDTRADRMNSHIHLAWWAQRAGNYRAAKDEIQQLLLLNPSSGIGFTYLGNIAELEKNCAEAVRQWQKAIEIFTLDEDREDGGAGSMGRRSGILNLRDRASRCR